MALSIFQDRSRAIIRVVSSTAVASIVRHDQNGVTELNLAGGTPGRWDDYFCALNGPIEYRAINTDGTQEAASRTLDVGPTARLVSLYLDTAGTLQTRGIWVGVETITDLTEERTGHIRALYRLNTGTPYVYSMPGTVTGRVAIWAGRHERASRLRDHLLRHPLQYLRHGSLIGADRPVLVKGITIQPDGEAWSLVLEVDEVRAAVYLPVQPTVPNLATYTSSAPVGTLATVHDALAMMRR